MYLTFCSPKIAAHACVYTLPHAFFLIGIDSMQD